MVQTAVIGDPGSDRQGGEPDRGELSSFSPDGRRAAVVVHRGDLTRNVVVASLLVFRAADLMDGAKPDTVATFGSSSNRPAISQLRWLDDNRSLLLVGEREGQLPQVYRVDVITRRVTQLTTATREIWAYDVTADGAHLAYTLRRPTAVSDSAAPRGSGRVVSAPHVAAALGFWEGESVGLSTQLVVVHLGDGQVIPVPDLTVASIPGGEPGRTVRIGACDDDWHIALSPDGRFVARACKIDEAPEGWRVYSDPLLRSGMEPGGWGPSQFVLFDLAHNTASLILDAPLPLFELRPAPVWMSDGPSLIISNVYLPIGATAITDRDLLISTMHVAQIDARTLAVTPIAIGMSRRRSVARVTANRWEPGIRTLVLAREDSARRSLPAVAVRFQSGRWMEPAIVDGPGVPGRDSNGEVTLSLEQSLNERPVLTATQRGSGRKARVLDPNPDMADVLLGRVVEVTWQAPDSTRWRGGLYYPPDFVPGMRRPLVIQTHGFDPQRFSLHGGFTTGYAAQPLAALGFVVLQMSNLPAPLLGTPRETGVAQRGIEAAIDYLDSLGVIDRKRVGLLGFSRTTLHVKYTLTHSRYPITAAVVSDGVDLSYVSYALFGHIQAFYEAVVGAGPPFGPDLDAWAREAPGFNVDKVQAAVRIQAIRPEILLGEWEMFSGLRRLGKPVELYYFPDGIHLLVKPQERFEASQGSVDWFRFWLMDEEDTDPAKAAQYTRWRRMRESPAWSNRHRPGN